MKRLITIPLATLAALALAFALLAPKLLGFSATQLPAAVRVATGMGAKLACSAYFVSGFDKDRILEDLASYSPANRLLDLEYGAQSVTATLFGLGKTSATFRKDLGCSLDIGNTAPLNTVRAPAPIAVDAPWPAGDKLDSIDPALQLRLDAILAKDNGAGLDTRALVVVQDGKLVAESYGPGIDARTPLLGWSMGKSVTAMLYGRMEALEIANSAGTPLFSSWADDARAKIEMDDLLHMASGLQFDETYAPGSDSTRMLFNAHSASDVAMDSPALHTPGQHFSYSSGTTNLIARWVHDQLGGSAQESINFLHRELLQPLGMQHTILETDPSGVFVGSSYIYASGRDWARLGQVMLDKGEMNGQRILSEDWVARAQAPNNSENDPRYGYQFWLNGGGDALRFPELPADAYFMLGNREQALMISPATGTVIVRVGWTATDYPTGENFSQLLPASH
ncbi:serine hydrolase domain-containing protein [Biformimicrobium ophioploci]|uniref:Serine hydrolase n=1 Tax=Biformimicrobium ophioploci TaxID=3036711 RepID=A0ABQ6LVA0_9GAMM|nr:serine hydrolase [Microbulbifer sp. NKW57]GMG85972.1 serine hydrolase [Microbulbifer sp. NKW57]